MTTYDDYQCQVDRIMRSIRELRNNKQDREADIKKLDLIYAKINYNQEHIDLAENSGNRPHKSYIENLNVALSEIADYRDYLYEKYSYEEQQIVLDENETKKR